MRAGPARALRGSRRRGGFVQRGRQATHAHKLPGGRVEDYRLARTHAQPGGSGAGACPGAEERGGTTEHAQVGPAGAGQEPAGC